MRLFLLLPLLLGFSVPAIAHNEANGGNWRDCDAVICSPPAEPIATGLPEPNSLESDGDEGHPPDCVAPCGDNTDGKAAKLRAEGK